MKQLRCHLPLSIGLLLLLVNILSLPSLSQAWPTNFFRGSRIGYGRNIRPIHCVEKRKNIGGICMFAWDCMKSNGTHLGTCIDRFYFGSCCQLTAIPRPPQSGQGSDIETNELEDGTASDFEDYSTDTEEGETKPGDGAAPDISMASKHPIAEATDVGFDASFPEVDSDPAKDPSNTKPTFESSGAVDGVKPPSENGDEFDISSDKFHSPETGAGAKPGLGDSETSSGLDTVFSDASPDSESSQNALTDSQSDSDKIAEEQHAGLESKPDSHLVQTSESGTNSIPDSESNSDSSIPSSESSSDSSIPSSESSSDSSMPSSESSSDSSMPSSESSSDSSMPSSGSGSDSSMPVSESSFDSSVPASESGSDSSIPASESGSDSMLDSDSPVTDFNESNKPDSGASVVESESDSTSVLEFETNPDSISDSDQSDDSVTEPDTGSSLPVDSNIILTEPEDNSGSSPNLVVESDPVLVDSEAESTVAEAENDTLEGSKGTEAPASVPDLPTTTESLFFGGGVEKVPDEQETSVSVGLDEDYELKPFGLDVITSTADSVTDSHAVGVTEEESNTGADHVTEFEDSSVTDSRTDATVILMDDTSVTEKASGTPSSEDTEEASSDSITKEETKVPETTTFEYEQEAETSTSPDAPSTSATESSMPEDVSTEGGSILIYPTEPLSGIETTASDLEDTKEESVSDLPEVNEGASTPSVIPEEVPVTEYSVLKTTTDEGGVATAVMTTAAPPQVEETTEIKNSWNEVEIIDNFPSSATPSVSTESSGESAKISIAAPDEDFSSSEGPPSSNLTTMTPAPVESMSLAEQETLLVQMLKIANYKDVCGKPVYPISRIVGGLEASYGEWPWQVSLRQWRSVAFLHKCGSALVNENWAITAAHCVEGIEPDQLLLVMGEFDLGTTKEPYGHVERSVQVIAMHPKFEPRTFEYDLALLRFSEPITFQPNIIPICIPEDDYNFLNDTGFVTGWGRLYEDGPLPTVMQKVPVPVIPNKDCEGMYKEAGYIEHIPNIFICAGYQAGKQDSCEGDSGGPMVINYKERWRLAGIISWGIGCAVPNQPGVYTRISEFREWINKIIRF